MANKIKDTDYLAISARVRAMETTLLTAERMERLLEARSDEEVSKLLQDCGYPELDAARPEAMDAALSQAREELLTDLGDGAPDPRYIDIFKLKYDYHNAKAILKAAAMGTSPDRMLMDMGRIGAAELKTAVESGELDKLPGALPAAVAEAKSTAMPALLSLSITWSSHSNVNAPSTGSILSQLKIASDTTFTPASPMRRISSSNVSSGHWSGL